MKQLSTFFAILVSVSLAAQFPCEGGVSFGYPCDGYDLQSKLFLSQMDASDGNDSWGWTDPQTGKEYALVGLDNGTAFIDISDPVFDSQKAVYTAAIAVLDEALHKLPSASSIN